MTKWLTIVTLTATSWNDMIYLSEKKTLIKYRFGKIHEKKLMEER